MRQEPVRTEMHNYIEELSFMYFADNRESAAALKKSGLFFRLEVQFDLLLFNVRYAVFTRPSLQFEQK